MTKEYRGVKPSEFVPEPPVAPPVQPFTPLGFSEPGDPPVDWDLPVAIQFVKTVFVGGKQLPGIDLKNEKQFRIRMDYDRSLVWLRYDNGHSVAVASTPFVNVSCCHWGLNARHLADGAAA